MRYFISPAERLRSGSVCCALLHRHLREEGEERLGKERRGGVVQRVERETGRQKGTVGGGEGKGA